MTSHAFVLDTWFYHPFGSSSFEAKCEMAKAAGYDGILFTLWTEQSWADVPRFGAVREQFGVDVTGVYAAINDPSDAASVTQVRELVERLEGCTALELAILGSPAASHNSDPAGDAPVLGMLEGLAGRAEERGITISLYPHAECWMERTQDAVRLVEALGSDAVRAVFSSYHWYVADGSWPDEVLREAAPYLHSVNICGAKRGVGTTGMGASVELLDDGELDNFALLGLLKRFGYRGPIGIQGYSIAGDVYPKIERALRRLREMEARLEAHPDWAQLRNDPLPKATGVE